MGNELLFQLLSRLGLELPPNEGQNPIARALRTDPYTPDDEPYLRQFMGIPKDGGLVPTDLRPTHLTKTDDLPWYRPSVSPLPNDSSIMMPGVIESLKAGDAKTIAVPNKPGLGHFTMSVGKGDSGNPYLSVYDKWDFDSPVVHPLIQRMMNTRGKGFHVYERYPLQKGSNGYKVGGDIRLPDEGKK